VRELLPGRLVVVSPHLDDAVFSLGASISRASGAGRRIDVLTVFAGVPESTAPAGGWDKRGGFATEGEAARARRLEDREACEIVGAEPSWLSISEADYAAPRDEEAVWAAVAQAVAGADAVLVPGFPLTNPDHAWLSELLVRRLPRDARVGFYAEQPYRYTTRRQRRRPLTPSFLPRLQGSRWTRPAAGRVHRRAKRRAVLAYRSQMPLLGFSRDGWRKLDGMLRHEALHRGEAVLWLQTN
jgi:LmbE family N-acetylglucosaminyl deacetylase